MEPPASLAPADLQAARESIIGKFRPIDPAEVVLGQYEGYRDAGRDRAAAPGPRPSSRPGSGSTRPRWRGVPFLLRTGKRLHQTHQTRQPDPARPGRPVDRAAPAGNVLRFELDGSGEIDLSMVAKQPGVGLTLGAATAPVPVVGDRRHRSRCRPTSGCSTTCSAATGRWSPGRTGWPTSGRWPSRCSTLNRPAAAVRARVVGAARGARSWPPRTAGCSGSRRPALVGSRPALLAGICHRARLASKRRVRRCCPTEGDKQPGPDTSTAAPSWPRWLLVAAGPNLSGSSAMPTSSTLPAGRLARERALGLALLLPSLVVFGLFIFWPLVRTFQLSTTGQDLFGRADRSVGLANFKAVLHDPQFGQVLGGDRRLRAADRDPEHPAGAGAGTAAAAPAARLAVSALGLRDAVRLLGGGRLGGVRGAVQPGHRHRQLPGHVAGFRAGGLADPARHRADQHRDHHGLDERRLQPAGACWPASAGWTSSSTRRPASTAPARSGSPARSPCR